MMTMTTMMMVFSGLSSSSSGTYQRYYFCANNNTNKNVMVFDTKKGAQRKRKDESKKHTHHKKKKRNTQKGRCVMKLLYNRAQISHEKWWCCCGHTPSQKRIYSSYFCTFCALFCELSADFHAKESLTFSRKIRPVVVVVELFVLFARDRGTKDEKRASSSRSRALFKKWNYS